MKYNIGMRTRESSINNHLKLLKLQIMTIITVIIFIRMKV